MDQNTTQDTAVRDNGVEKYLEEAEKELLQIIIDNMEKGEMTLDDAHILARDYMALLPVTDKNDLMHKLEEYTNMHPGTQSIVDKVKQLVEVSRSRDTLEKMKHLIKAGDIKTAIEAVKGGND